MARTVLLYLVYSAAIVAAAMVAMALAAWLAAPRPEPGTGPAAASPGDIEAVISGAIRITREAAG